MTHLSMNHDRKRRVSVGKKHAFRVKWRFLFCFVFVFHKSTKNTQQRKISAINDIRKARIFTCKRMKLNHYNIPYTKTINKSSKWIKDLNIRPDTEKVLKRNVGRMFHNLSWAMIFWIQPVINKNSKVTLQQKSKASPNKNKN